jgi:hypothetical protein
MDSGEILYNFDLNNNSLDEITRHLNDIKSARDDIEAMFARLAEWYQGSGSDGLMAAKQNILNMLDDANDTTISTQQLAMEQQQSMDALDKMHAADFGGY